MYITDCDHEYRDINVPVIDQGIVQRGQMVSIGEGSYIGINAVIVGKCKDRYALRDWSQFSGY